MINKIKNFIYKLLRKSQKFTETDNVYLAKYGSYLTIGSIASMAIAFLSSIAFARLLPKEIYGQYRYILSIVTILAISSLQGMNDAVIQGVARGFEGVFIKGFKTKLKWSLFGSIVSIGIAVYFWLQNNIAFAISFLIIAIFLPLFKSGELYQFYLAGKKLFARKVNYTILIQFLATAFLVLTLFLTKNLIVLILVYFFSYGILRMFFCLWTIKKIKPNKKYDSKTISYGKHLSLMGIIGLIAEQIDKILLFYFMGPVNLAIYSFATLPVDQLRAPLQNIQELALPKLSTRSSDEIKKTLPKKLLKSIIFILILIIIYIILVPYFFKIFYPQYMDSVSYSRLFCFDLLVFPISMMMLALQAKMKTRELYKINIINPIVRIILLIIFIPVYGILGAIIAILLSQIFYFFIAQFFFKKM